MKKTNLFKSVGILFVLLICGVCYVLFNTPLRSCGNPDEDRAAGYLRTLSSAAESYGVSHFGLYPAKMSDLTDADPPYIDEDFCDNVVHNNYLYQCEFSEKEYFFQAAPDKVVSDESSLSIKTGGIFEGELSQCF